MTGTDLLSHLQFLGRHFLDERRVGWAFARHQGRANGDVVDVLRIVYAGPTRSGMTLQQVVGAPPARLDWPLDHGRGTRRA